MYICKFTQLNNGSFIYYLFIFIQKKIMTGIESLCDYMPGATSKLCKEEVEKMLPLAINLITGLIVSRCSSIKSE